jgi:Protein kinase domain/Septum formation
VLLGRLGSGGMGRVYLARSPGGRMVAVKVIRANLAEDAGFRARFAREVSAARKVGGLFTAQVVDADIDGPVPWLVTAYVPGTSLSEAVERQGPLPESSVLALAAGLAEGLIAIHAAGVIHRDLKPSNVLLAQDGPRIIDFGISSAAEATALTGTGFMIGSPGFMSPEQAEGLTVGPASDIFSLAGVLIYAARGEGPFGSGDTAALLYRVVHGKPSMDGAPDKLRPLIKRSLSRDPRRRPTAAQFLADLSATYPAAADLSNWLPPWISDPSAPGAAADTSVAQPSSMAGGSAAGGAVIGGSAISHAAAGGAMAGRPASAEPDLVAEPDPVADAVAPMALADEAGPAMGGSATFAPATRTSHTPPPATGLPEAPPGEKSYPGHPGAQGYSGQQGYSDRYPGRQQYPEPQGYPAGQGGQGDPVAPGGSWWSGQPGGTPQTPLPGSDQWHSPPAGSSGPPPRKRPKWLVPAGAAAAIVVIVVALVLALGPGSSSTSNAGNGASRTPSSAASDQASPGATPTVGGLTSHQFQVGDCLTGANMQLNKATPWPKVTQAVPCSQAHTAEVFYANDSYWAKGGPYPGESAIENAARSQCDNAFQSYVGIAYSQSMYTWAFIVPGASTWPDGDRALHCVAYYPTSAQPAGAVLHGSIKGTAK